MHVARVDQARESFAADWEKHPFSGNQTIQEQVDVMLDVSVRVETVAVAEVEGMAPDRHQHQGGDHQACDVVEVHAPELAAVDAQPHRALDHRVSAADHFRVIEPPQLREVAAFGDHQLGDATVRCGADELPPALGQLAHQVGGIAAVLVDHALAPLERRHQSFAHDGLEQLVLAVEIEIERAFADAGALGHVLQAGSRVAALDEELEGGARELGGSGLLAAGPAGNWLHDGRSNN